MGNEEEITLGMAGGSLTSCPVHQCGVSGEMEEEQSLSQLETVFPLAQPSDELNQPRASLRDLGHWLEVVVLLQNIRAFGLGLRTSL